MQLKTIVWGGPLLCDKMIRYQCVSRTSAGSSPLLAGDDLHRDRVDSRAPLVLPVYRQIGTARDPDCLSVAAMFRIWMASRSRGLQSPNPTGECSRPFPRSNHRSRQAPPSKRRRVVHRYDMLNRLGQIPSHVTYYKTQYYFGRLEVLNLHSRGMGCPSVCYSWSLQLRC